MVDDRAIVAFLETGLEDDGSRVRASAGSDALSLVAGAL
jgi:hypothetical protein